MKPYYITAAIDYPVASPHLGHAFEKLAVDVQARYRRLLGRRTFLTVGNDEHSSAAAKRAGELHARLPEFIDGKAVLFHATWDHLQIDHDLFVRTTASDHHRGCEMFFRDLLASGYLYEAPYASWYCDGCETLKRPVDLVGTRCPSHPTRALEWVEGTGHHFRLGAFKDRLTELYRARPELIQPRWHLPRVERGIQELRDIPVTWERRRGVRLGSHRRMHVWVDALLSYLTSVGYGSDAEHFENHWPADAHVIGRDILWFHAILWPALLMAVGLPEPREIQVHGLLLVGGKKMSQSSGNGLDPLTMIDRFGSDGLRYALFRNCSFHGGADVELGSLQRSLETELERLVDLERHVAAQPIRSPTTGELAPHYSTRQVELVTCFRAHMDAFDYASALAGIASELLSVDAGAPDLRRRLSLLATLLQPFAPTLCASLQGTLVRAGIDPRHFSLQALTVST